MQQAGFFIEATSHCRDGKFPRWSFLIQGVGGSERHGMIGTDRQGRGLYLYGYQRNTPAVCRELVSADSLCITDNVTRLQANEIVMNILRKLGWGEPQQPIPREIPTPGLRLVSSR